MKSIHTKLIIMFFAILSLGTLFVSSDNYEFDDAFFSGSFSGVQNNNADIHFNKNGNNFGGKIFFQGITDVSDTVVLSGFSTSCSKQIKGYYMNTARGLSMRPLDTDTLNFLQSIDSSYSVLSLSGGLFIGCDGDTQHIYGSIRHTINNENYYLIAGTTYDFIYNLYVPIYGQTFSLNALTSSGYIFDNHGGIGMISGFGLNIIFGEEDIIDLPNSSSAIAMNDRLIASGYTNGLLSIRPELTEYLVGNKRIRTRDSDGKILAAVIMQSSGVTNKIEVQIPAGTRVKNTNNDIYTGTISVPAEIPTNTVALSNVVYAASFGSTGAGINFEDIDYMPTNITIRMPVPGQNNGEFMDIYYSEDNGATWIFHIGTIVTLINGEPYVEFDTTHFTDFAVTLPGGGGGGGGSFVGSFTINNDDTSTTSNSVTLNNSTTPTAVQMRFANTLGGLSTATREAYSTTKSRTLPGTYGTKTVYAQFDADGNGTSDAETSDSISYSAGGGGSCAAGSYCGDLKLRILTGHSYCQYGTTLDFGTTGLSYSGRSLITGFVTTGGDTQRFCEDQQGLGTRALTIQSSNLVNSSTNIAAQTIPASSVFIKNPAAYIPQGEGVCTFSSGDSLNQRVNLSGAKEILGKVGTVGEGCKIITDNLSLKVDLTGAQAIGQYSGTLTINVPNF